MNKINAKSVSFVALVVSLTALVGGYYLFTTGKLEFKKIHDDLTIAQKAPPTPVSTVFDATDKVDLEPLQKQVDKISTDLDDAIGRLQTVENRQDDETQVGGSVMTPAVVCADMCADKKQVEDLIKKVEDLKKTPVVVVKEEKKSSKTDVKEPVKKTVEKVEKAEPPPPATVAAPEKKQPSTVDFSKCKNILEKNGKKVCLKWK